MKPRNTVIVAYEEISHFDEIINTEKHLTNLIFTYRDEHGKREEETLILFPQSCSGSEKNDTLIPEMGKERIISLCLSRLFSSSLVFVLLRFHTLTMLLKFSSLYLRII